MCREMKEYRRNLELYSVRDEKIDKINAYIDENIKAVFDKTKVILERNRFLEEKTFHKQKIAV